MARFLLLICLFFPSLAQAEINVSLPDYMNMREVSTSLNAAQRAQMAQIAKPNDMIALFFPQDAVLGVHNIPDDVIIIAVPKGNPQILFEEFPLLKNELRPRLKQTGALIYEDNARWMGATKTHVLTQNGAQATYLLSNAIISLEDRVLMVQYLRTASGNDDLTLLHRVMSDIVTHLLRANGKSDLAPFQTKKAKPPASETSDKKTPLFVPRSAR